MPGEFTETADQVDQGLWYCLFIVEITVLLALVLGNPGTVEQQTWTQCQDEVPI